MDQADLMMTAMARVQEGIRAIAVGDDDRVLRIVNDSSDDEAHAMAAALFSLVRASFVGLVRGDEAEAMRLLLRGADGMDEDIVANGARIIVREELERAEADDA